MDASLFLKNVFENLSGKEKKHLARLEKIISRPIALGLLSMHSKVSAQELDMVADVLCLFGSVKIYSVRESPRQVVFEGVHQEWYVRIHSQYIVKKPKDHPHYLGSNNSPCNYWAIDCAIELLQNDVRCAVLGFEYDGHVAHFVESNIKRSYVRDWGIFAVEGFIPLRVSPEQWKLYSDYYKNVILRHLDREVRKCIGFCSNELRKFNEEQEKVPDFIVKQSGNTLVAVPLTRELIEAEMQKS